MLKKFCGISRNAIYLKRKFHAAGDRVDFRETKHLKVFVQSFSHILIPKENSSLSTCERTGALLLKQSRIVAMLQNNIIFSSSGTAIFLADIH
jgi:hypothetical protein